MTEVKKPELADTVAESSPPSPDAGPTSGSMTALPRGATVGRYLLLDAVGAGGMGVVYEAYDPELDRRVALKLVRTGLHSVGPDTEGRARVLREAQGIARLAHPNVVAIYDVGTADENLFIAMELIDGETLAAWLRTPRSIRDILDMFIQAGRGLAAAHNAGLVHRDFKPDNVLVGHDGRARVVDFGLVREVNAPHVPAATVEKIERVERISGPRIRPSEPALATPLTLAGMVMGTVYYMAPEQMDDRPTDARSDQYAFCVSLYEALAGHVPFGGADYHEVRAKVLGSAPPELPTNRKIPAHVRDAIMSGLARDPDKRWASMDALLADLARDPAATRRRWLVTGGVVAALGAAIAVPMALRRSAGAECDLAGARIESAWGPTHRTAVHDAFVATKMPYAESSFHALSERLDAYAAAWAKSSDDSCRATHQRREQSAALLDLRSACLQRRHTELATFVGLMREATPKSIQRAHVAAANLSPIADCDDLEALQGPVPLPQNPTVRGELAAAREELARAFAMVTAGKFGDAIARTRPLVEMARHLGHRPFEAEVRVMLGKVLGRTGQEAEARGQLVAGFTAAIAGRDDNTAIAAATALVQVLADMADFTAAQDWSALALATLERIGSPAGERRAALHHVTGYAHAAAGRHAEAIKEHEQSLAIRERYGGLNLGKTLTSLAYNYDEVGRYKDARMMAERSLALQEAELGPDHPEIASILMNLGNIADDEGDLDSAVAMYTRALRIREATVAAGDDPMGVAAILNNLGVVELERKHYPEAMELQERALAIRQGDDADGGEVAMSYVNIGDILHEQGQQAAALANYEKSLALAEATLGTDHPYVGDALLGIGKCTQHGGDLERSQQSLERALAIRTAGSRPVELADVQLALADTLWQRGAQVRARELAITAEATFAATPGPAAADKRAEATTWLAAHPAP